MDHINDHIQPEDIELPAVTGRKAARSLMIFRGDGRNLETLIDSDHPSPQHISFSNPETMSSTATKNETAAESALLEPTSAPQRPILEHASSATYFPHLPRPVRDFLANDDPVSGISPETADLQHLMADLEFDHDRDGDITQIKNHKSAQKGRKVNFAEPLDDSDHEHHDLSRIVSHSSEEVFPLTVELRPFKNKVGGHTAIFRFSKRAVCKALMNRENLWYEAVERKHPELLKFIPRYIGVLNVRYSSLVSEESSAPSLPHLDQGPPESITSGRRSSLPSEKPKKNRISEDGPPPEVSLDDNRHIIPSLLRRHYSSSAPSPSTMENLSSSPEVFSRKSSDLGLDKHGADTSLGSTSVNTDLQAQIIQEVFVPPGKKSENIFEMDDDEDLSHNEPRNDEKELNGAQKQEEHTPVLRKHTRFERFILLEDLTTKMKRPCALDLKMGTRQYGLEANDAKQASQRKKCALTTSRELGVRICGLQVWDQSQDKYYMKDKYFGRQLKAGEPFARTLAKFLYDGRTAYSIVVKIPCALKQLAELYDVFKNLCGYRMYGSSVLLMYDGAANSEEAKLMVHIIDFAQSVIGDESDLQQYNKPPKHPHMPDMGYLRGLRSIKYYLEKIFEIVTGAEYAQVSDSVQEYLESNKQRLQERSKWVEDEESSITITPDNNTDSDGISD